MSAYKNFIADFPGRCKTLLDLTEKYAKIRGHEVTLLFMVASTGFLVPYERLRPLGKNGEAQHPSGDRTAFANFTSKFDSLQKSNFKSSQLWTPNNPDWRQGSLKSIPEKPEYWDGVESKPIDKSKTVVFFTKLFRNALAHGGIVTHDSPITEIIFYQEHWVSDRDTKKQDGYDFIKISPATFRDFLLNWLDFLEEQQVNPYDFVDKAEAA